MRREIRRMAILSKIDMMYCSSLLPLSLPLYSPPLDAAAPCVFACESQQQFSPTLCQAVFSFFIPSSSPPLQPFLSIPFPAIEAKILTDQSPVVRGEERASERANEWEKRILYPEKIKNGMRDEAVRSRFRSFLLLVAPQMRGRIRPALFQSAYSLSSLCDNLCIPLKDSEPRTATLDAGAGKMKELRLETAVFAGCSRISPSAIP